MCFYKILSFGEGLFCVATNSSRTDFKIVIDADSCPVTDVVIKVARQTSIPVLAVASISHVLNCQEAGVTVIEVDNIPQAADVTIVNNVKDRDIVITGDYGLASVALARGARAISPRGLVFSAENIDRLLLQRHIDAKIRQGGGRTKGPKSFTAEDRDKFEQALRRMIGDRWVT